MAQAENWRPSEVDLPTPQIDVTTLADAWRSSDEEPVNSGPAPISVPSSASHTSEHVDVDALAAAWHSSDEESTDSEPNMLPSDSPMALDPNPIQHHSSGPYTAESFADVPDDWLGGI